MTGKRKTVLVLGGAGFIGGHIVRELLHNGYDVCIYSTSGSGLKNLADIKTTHADRLTWVVAKSMQSERLQQLLANAWGVVHAAIPYPIYSLGWRSRWKKEKQDLEFLLSNLLQHRHIRCVFVSVSGTIGQVPGGFSHEGIAYNKWQLTTSLHMKQLAEALIQKYVAEGLQGVIVNPSLCIGDWDTKPSSGKFMIVACTLPFRFLSSFPVNVTSVRNVAKGTVLALTRGRVGERYLLGDVNTTFGEYMSRLRGVAGKKDPLVQIPLPLIWFIAFCSECIGLLLRKPAPELPLLAVDLVRYGLQHYDLAKMKNELGVEAEPLNQAISEAYTWFTTHHYLNAGQQD